MLINPTEHHSTITQIQGISTKVITATIKVPNGINLVAMHLVKISIGHKILIKGLAVTLFSKIFLHKEITLKTNNLTTKIYLISTKHINRTPHFTHNPIKTNTHLIKITFPLIFKHFNKKSNNLNPRISC